MMMRRLIHFRKLLSSYYLEQKKHTENYAHTHSLKIFFNTALLPEELNRDGDDDDINYDRMVTDQE